MKNRIFILYMAFGSILIPATMVAYTVQSPNRAISLEAYVKDGVPVYSISYKNRTVVNPSSLGVKLAKAPDLTDGFEVVGTRTSSFDETWVPVWGEKDSIRNHYNEMVLELIQPDTDRKMNIRFRVYDDGVGFRYEWPQQKNLNYFVIEEEMSEFAMTGDHTAWWIAGDYDTQEYNYTESRLSEIRENYLKKCGELEREIATSEICRPICKALLKSRDEALMLDVLNRYYLTKSKSVLRTTGPDLVFQKFMMDLQRNYACHHDTIFYARRSSLSPKYFSAVIKQVSGAAPKEWIIQTVIAVAQNYLTDTSMTIKEISSILGFPSQAFFCKYFKRYTSCTPSEYRIGHRI